MKKEGGYRFSLQFPGDTEAQVRVGELLERLGRRKSGFIVRAVISYLDSHPEEDVAASNRMETVILTREEVKSLILSVIGDMRPDTPVQPEKQMEACAAIEQPENHTTSSNAQQADIDAMLKNLDVFSW